MNQYLNLPVLITGGCGFIGSHIAKMLVSLGAKVTVIDNCLTGTLDALNDIKDSVTIIKKSITDPHACLEATQGKKIVFHLAALVSVPLSMENPSLCHQTNTEGTFNLLEASRLHEVERFIFSSSAAVNEPKNESCSQLNECAPTSAYGYSKLLGELYCQQYAQLFGLRTLSLRYFNVWDKSQTSGGPYADLVANCRERMKHNEPLIIYGDGLQTKDFVSVQEVVKANITLGMLPDCQMNGEIHTIPTSKSMTLLDIIESLKQDYPDYTAPIIFKPSRNNDLKHSSSHYSNYLTIKEQCPGYNS